MHQQQDFLFHHYADSEDDYLGRGTQRQQANNSTLPPAMSMYQQDPATNLTIVYPRIYRLRQMQARDGVDISHLRLEQRGLAPITYMHHVSKIIEGKTESYRVRVCRTCSGLSSLLELGSYTDVESALLVNDAHELMQGRTRQLHLLCTEDTKYFDNITVRRRGATSDLSISNVLNERVWKSSSKKVGEGGDGVSEVGAVAGDHDTTEGPDVVNQTNDAATESSKGNMLSSPNEKRTESVREKTVDMNTPSSSSGALSSLIAAAIKTDGEASECDMNGDAAVASRSDGKSNAKGRQTSSGRGDRDGASAKSTDPTTTSQSSGHSRPSSQAYTRASRIVDQLKSNLSKFHTNFLLWNFFSSEDEIDVMFDALGDFVGAELSHVISSASLRRNLSRGGGAPADTLVSVASAETRLRQCWAKGDAPRSVLLSTIASVFPGNANEMQTVCRRIAAILPQDSLSVSRFRECHFVAVKEVKKFERDVAALLMPSMARTGAQLRGGNGKHTGVGVTSPHSRDTTTTVAGATTAVASGNGENSSSNGHHRSASNGEKSLQDALVAELMCFSFAETKNFIKQCYNSAAYFDYTLRLSNWDGELTGVQEAEVKLHGIYAQIESRLSCLEQLLHRVQVAAATASKFDAAMGLAGRSSSASPRTKSDDGDAAGLRVSSSSSSLKITNGEEGRSSQGSASLSDDVSKIDGGENGSSGAGAVVVDIAALNPSLQISAILTKVVRCAVYVISTLCSCATVAWRLCGDMGSATACIRTCNNFLPILVKNISNPMILQQFLQRHLDSMSAMLLYGGTGPMGGFGVIGQSPEAGKNFVFSRVTPVGSGIRGSGGGGNSSDSNSEEEDEGTSHVELRLLAFSLGGEIVKQTRRCFSSFPRQLSGPAIMFHLEAAFRAYTSIFLASIALEESDLLVKLGYTMSKLLGAANDVLTSLSERIGKQSCTLVCTHTIISLHAMAEACIFNMKSFPECATTIFMIVRSCRLLLWGCSSRFVLAKMFLEHIAAEESKRLMAEDTEQASHLLRLRDDGTAGAGTGTSNGTQSGNGADPLRSAGANNKSGPGATVAGPIASSGAGGASAVAGTHTEVSNNNIASAAYRQGSKPPPEHAKKTDAAATTKRPHDHSTPAAVDTVALKKAKTAVSSSSLSAPAHRPGSNVHKGSEVDIRGREKEKPNGSSADANDATRKSTAPNVSTSGVNPTAAAAAAVAAGNTPAASMPASLLAPNFAGFVPTMPPLGFQGASGAAAMFGGMMMNKDMQLQQQQWMEMQQRMWQQQMLLQQQKLQQDMLQMNPMMRQYMEMQQQNMQNATAAGANNMDASAAAAKMMASGMMPFMPFPTMPQLAMPGMSMMPAGMLGAGMSAQMFNAAAALAAQEKRRTENANGDGAVSAATTGSSNSNVVHKDTNNSPTPNGQVALSAATATSAQNLAAKKSSSSTADNLNLTSSTSSTSELQKDKPDQTTTDKSGAPL